MKVSVIIPVFNSSQFLKRSLESVLTQSYQDLEIIVVDDGSIDNSVAIAREYEGEQVKVIVQENAGAAVARNTGLRYATGDYIQFLDSGDVLSKDKIEKQVQALQREPGKVAVCNYMQFTHPEELVNPVYPDQGSFIYSCESPVDFLVNLWGGKGCMNFIQTNCWLTPRSVIEKAGPWRNYRCPDDDGEFFARVLLASRGIVYVPGVYNYYHITPGGQNQLSRSKNRKYLQNTLLTIDLKHRYLLEKCNHPLINKAIAAQYLRFAVDMYPSQKVLSAIALKRYRSLGEKAETPVLGGIIIEWLKKLAGWKMARLVRYYLRER